MKDNSLSAALLEVFADLEEMNMDVNAYRAVPRLIWYPGVERQECDGEHCMQIAFIADYLNERYNLGMDTAKLYRYALRHDFVERHAGDTPAFPDLLGMYSIPKKNTKESKEQREREALKKIEAQWGERYPSLHRSIHAYESRADEESRFIYALDKFIAILNIAQDQGRTNHRLGVTLDAEEAYKRPKIAQHSFVLKLYEVFHQKMQRRPDLYAQAPPAQALRPTRSRAKRSPRKPQAVAAE